MTHWTAAPRKPLFRRTRLLLLPVIGATVLSAIVASVWKELGLNLLADCIALGFGVFVSEVYDAEPFQLRQNR